MSESTRAQLVDAIRRMRADGSSYHAIGRELGVSQQAAWRAVNGPGRRPGGTRRPGRAARLLSWPLRSPWTRRDWALGIAVAIPAGVTLGLLIRRVRAIRARDTELRARILEAAANDAERTPAPLESPSPSTPADGDAAVAETPSAPAPSDPAHIDERPPELTGPLDAFGRAIPPKGSPPPPPVRPYPPRRLH